MKMDSHLAVCGSVKARGGMFEVLNYAAIVAEQAKNPSRDDASTKYGLYVAPPSCGSAEAAKEASSADLATDPACRAALARHQVVVGSTGNLGLSVGLSAAALGMQSTVHMSVDAKKWKKDLLRQRGAGVVEHEGLIEEAYAGGRRACEADPCAHFIDDETSKVLKLGYACAAFELKAQLEEMGVVVDKEHPLVVHIPCGVGGAPGGICWGLEHAFGENAANVHTFFAEPVAAPCCTLAFAAKEISPVADIGLDGKTEADGLAVGKASEVVIQMVDKIVAGAYTVQDEELFHFLRKLTELEGEDLFIEPSCCAGLAGPRRMRESASGASGDGLVRFGIQRLVDEGTHVFWATGGSLVPPAQREELLKKYL